MCTSITAGKFATIDGSILVSRNEDCLRSNWNKYMVYREKSEYANKNVVADGIWTLGNGLQVPVPDKNYRYSAMPDAGGYKEASYTIDNRYFFEERGINEKNFAISATNSLTTNPCANTVDPLLGSGGIAEAVIPTLLLPQAESAKDAVLLLGGYVESCGASEANGILFADPNEAWYFEIGSGHHWIAVRVPKDCYLVVANGMRVHSVDLDDHENVIYSNGLYDFVCTHQLLSNPDRKIFNYAEAFGVLGVDYNTDRVWLAQHILSPSVKQEPRMRQYPLFLKADEKINLQCVMNVLRATYKGTVLEGKATRPIGYDKTAESHIITLNSEMPDELVGMIWQAVSTPLYAPYLPFYRTMHMIPPGYSMGSNEYSATSAYWAFRGLSTLANEKKETFLPEVKEMWEAYEQGFVQEQPFLKSGLIDMYKFNPGTATNFAGRYSTGIAYQAVGKANEERNKLMTKLTQLQTPQKTAGQ